MTTLLVGEGDFSFSVKLSETTQKFVASCLSSVNPNCDGTEENIQILKGKGITVRTDVDARKLDNFSEFISGNGRFKRVIFNFPHIGGKMHVGRNRDLLKDFFAACHRVLDEDGIVEVTLCAGQGGTPLDKPRRYQDTWKIIDMAAYSGFVLVDARPFTALYNNVGYRSLSKAFNVEGAISHTFQFAGPPPFLDTFISSDGFRERIPRKIMFPVEHNLDFSFWVSDEESSLVNGLRNLCLDDMDVCVKCLKDTFTRDGRTSFCFELVVRSDEYCLSRDDVMINFVKLLGAKLKEKIPSLEARI